MFLIIMQYHKDFYINRLIKEWLSHEKLIVACDLDDTLLPYNLESKETCKKVKNLLLECQVEGIYLIINTARDYEMHETSIKEVEKLGLSVSSINQNVRGLNLPYGNSGKVYANIFLDDRAGLECALYQLSKALGIIKQIREQQKLKQEL